VLAQLRRSGENAHRTHLVRGMVSRHSTRRGFGVAAAPLMV